MHSVLDSRVPPSGRDCTVRTNALFATSTRMVRIADPWDGWRLGLCLWIRDQRRYGCRGCSIPATTRFPPADRESRLSTDVRRADHVSWPPILTCPHSGPAPPSVFAVHLDDTPSSMKHVPLPSHPCAGRPHPIRCLPATCKRHTSSAEAPGIGSACPAQAYARSAASSPTRPGNAHPPPPHARSSGHPSPLPPARPSLLVIDILLVKSDGSRASRKHDCTAPLLSTYFPQF
ncbi:hypothetical protein B0H10DRAFT_2133471 [Mycena sp. CBHHK59/15]|nr:hypothetical protein B0H10DRAFT_2133471 [Mycena sp. CBHHK59/15]